MTTHPTDGQPYGPPPQYGPPQGYGPAAYYHQPPPPTNMLAILSMVFAVVFAPAGLILGLIARNQIEESGEDGRGLALAGTIVGAVITGFWVLYAAFWVIMMIVLAAYG